MLVCAGLPSFVFGHDALHCAILVVLGLFAVGLQQVALLCMCFALAGVCLLMSVVDWISLHQFCSGSPLSFMIFVSSVWF